MNTFTARATCLFFVLLMRPLDRAGAKRVRNEREEASDQNACRSIRQLLENFLSVERNFTKLIRRCSLLYPMVWLMMSGCGVERLAEDTKDITEKTMHEVEESNQTQAEMLLMQAQMLEQIRQGNLTQAQLLALVAQSNSSMDLIASLNAQIRDLNEKIKTGVIKASDAVHLQIIGTALSEMFKAENTIQLKPPTRMMPFGEVLVKEATADEIMAITHLLLMDGAYGQGSTSSRAASLTGAGVIGGFTSLDKMKKIFETQVNQSGIYEDSAYTLAMVRYMFIRDVFFLPIIEKTKYLNKALLAKCVEHYEALKHLSTVPFVDRIELVISNLFLNEQLDPTDIVTYASRAKSRFQSRLPAALLGDSEVQSLLARFN